MSYVKNADLTLAHVLRLVARLGYQDITQEVCRYSPHPESVFLVVQTWMGDIIQFRDLAHARRVLRDDWNFLHQLYEPTFDRSEFEAWLVTHSFEIVGSTASEQSCPIARFLSDDQDNCSSYEVGYLTCWPVDPMVGSHTYKLPDWAIAFIHGLDFTCPFSEITGAQALQLLRQLEVR